MSLPDPKTEKVDTPPAGMCRRDLLVGGFTGFLAGGGGGVAIGRSLNPANAEPAIKAPDSFGLGWERALHVTFSQCGEDLIASWLLTNGPLNIAKPTYLDIGTHDPVLSNNTYTFYLRGGRGVLMEPNPTLAERIRKERPEDTLLVAGVGIDDSEGMDFYMFNDSQLNTFDKEYAERMQSKRGQKLERVIRVPLININRVIAEHLQGQAPDLLSIDVEGLDLAILETLDFKRYRPKVICVETIITTKYERNAAIPNLLDANGYELWGMTFANSIFLDRTVLPKG